MKISFILQFKDLLIMFGIGAILGIFYGLINIINTIKEHIFFRIVCDIIFTSVFTFTFLIIVEKINFGSIRFYLFLGYIIGFVIERISLGKIFAKGYKYVYNKLKLGIKKLNNSKMGRFIFK